MMNLNETAARHGFCVDRVRESEELHGQMVEMHHEKTGAQLVWVDNGEVNKTFCVAFKTLPEDSTGVFHTSVSRDTAALLVTLLPMSMMSLLTTAV